MEYSRCGTLRGMRGSQVQRHYLRITAHRIGSVVYHCRICQHFIVFNLTVEIRLKGELLTNSVVELNPYHLVNERLLVYWS